MVFSSVDFADLFPFAPEVGYLSLALVNFIGSLIPFVPLPGFLLLATMSVGDKFDLHVLALLSAVSATVAKQIIFYISYGGRKIIGTKARKRMLPFERLVKKYGAAAAFFAAATPIPDDLVYVPLGLARYNPRRFFIATLSGKIVLSYIIVVISHYTGLSLIEPILENIDNATPIYIGIITFGAAMTVIVIMLLRLDWTRILGRFAPWTLDDSDEEQKKDVDRSEGVDIHDGYSSGDNNVHASGCNYDDAYFDKDRRAGSHDDDEDDNGHDINKNTNNNRNRKDRDD